jgi:hypothetical protein
MLLKQVGISVHSTVLWHICQKQELLRRRNLERKTQTTTEVRVLTARCWVTNATMGSLLSAPRPLLRNDSIKAFQQYRRSFLCGRRGVYITGMKPVPVQPREWEYISTQQCNTDLTTASRRVIKGDSHCLYMR